MFQMFIRKIFGITDKQKSLKKEYKAKVGLKIEDTNRMSNLKYPYKLELSMLTPIQTNYKTFFPYKKGTIKDVTQYAEIDFDAARWSYLIINHDSGTYYQTTLIAGLMDKLNRLYGHEINIIESGGIYYCKHRQYETLYPSKLDFCIDGYRIEVMLVKNLFNSELIQILKSRGIKRKF